MKLKTGIPIFVALASLLYADTTTLQVGVDEYDGISETYVRSGTDSEKNYGYDTLHKVFDCPT